MSSYDIELTTGFSYHQNNTEVDAKFVRISGHTMKHIMKIAPIKELVMQALNNMIQGMNSDDLKENQSEKESNEVGNEDGNEDGDNNPEKVDGSAFMTMFMMNCKEGHTLKLIDGMTKLLVSGVAYLDGEVKLQNHHIGQMTPKDFETLCGEYIGNFISS